MNNSVNEKDLYIYCPHCAANLTIQIIDNESVKKCTKCGFIFWNNPKPVVSVLLHNKEKILMLQRTNEPFKDYWVLPGGFINHSETAKEAIKRETKEEIGLDINIDGIIGVYRIDNDPRGIHMDIIFKGNANGEIKLSKENKDYQYFSPDKLPEMIAYKHRDAINDWLKKGGQY